MHIHFDSAIDIYVSTQSLLLLAQMFVALISHRRRHLGQHRRARPLQT